MIKNLILTLSAAFILAGCDNGTPEQNTPENGTSTQSSDTQNTPTQSSDTQTEIGYGKIEDGIYSNGYFKLSVKVPEGWAVQSKAEQAEMMRAGGELIAGDDTNLKNALKASEKQSVSLFSFFKYKVGKPVPFNPSVIAVAERVSQQPGIERGSDYLYHVKQLLNAGQMQYSFPGEMETIDLSGTSFDVMTASVKAGPTTVTQEYYAAKINDYALGFIISYVSEEQRKELKAIIDDITLN